MTEPNGKAEKLECEAHPEGPCDPSHPDCLLYESDSFTVYVDTVTVLKVARRDKSDLTRGEAMDVAIALLSDHMENFSSAHSIHYAGISATSGTVH